MDREEFFLKRIRELANISYQRDIVTFSDFLDLNQMNMVKSQDFRRLGVAAETWGGYENAERQMVAFHPDALAFPWEYPIVCLLIRPRSEKFAEALTHRDYLGALLNLGTERSVIGDILVQDKQAWFFCQEKMSGFFIENLIRVRHTDVDVSLVTEALKIPAPRTETVHGTCSSVRLDALIALAYQASRSSMVSFIEKGLVFVNGRMITSNGYEPKEGDIISVRGKGRFVFEGVSRQTKKGRLSVSIQRYI